MRAQRLLDEIVQEYRRILGENLVGIYVHGSLAFGCFCWEQSDIDFIAVTDASPSLEEKEELIRVLLRMDAGGPKKGFEMSVVREEACRCFVHPTPFELHYSNAHEEACRRDLRSFCKEMNGVDGDLAAHFTVIRSVGIAIWGKEIRDVFGQVPREDYLDSIRKDVQSGVEDVVRDPVYVILNLCRVLAYQREGLVLSKEDGAKWGERNLPSQYQQLIRGAKRAYACQDAMEGQEGEWRAFAAYMEGEIWGHG